MISYNNNMYLYRFDIYIYYIRAPTHMLTEAIALFALMMAFLILFVLESSK